PLAQEPLDDEAVGVAEAVSGWSPGHARDVELAGDQALDGVQGQLWMALELVDLVHRIPGLDRIEELPGWGALHGAGLPALPPEDRHGGLIGRVEDLILVIPDDYQDVRTQLREVGGQPVHAVEASGVALLPHLF